MFSYKYNFIQTVLCYAFLLVLFYSPHLTAAIQEQKLVANDAAMVDLFGISVSVSGDYAVVGANQVEIDGDRNGAAYTYKFNGSSWIQSQKLLSSIPYINENYGAAVSISGDTIAVGSTNAFVGNFASAGVVYIYKRDVSGQWNETQRLIASDNDRYDKFGTSVSLENNQLIVGSPNDDDNVNGSGSAYIFEFNGTSWVETEKLTASNPASGDKFGFKVDINGNRAIVSSPYKDDITNGEKMGSVYVFEKNNNDWDETKILRATDMEENDNFGIDISLSNNRILIGAYGNDDAALNSGSAYVFEYNTTNSVWNSGLKINANDATANDRFGGAVKIEGNKMLIGAVSNDDGGDLNSGSVYSYFYNGSSWELIKLILHTDSPSRFTDAFGNAIDLDNNRAIIGSVFDDAAEGQTYNSGAAYIFDIDEKPVAVLDEKYINEDAVNVTIDVLSNDTDADEGLKILTHVNQPSHGVVTIVSDGTLVRYIPYENYCNDGVTTDDFTYTVNGGSSANVKVTINCIDDPANANDDSKTINEDSNVIEINVLENDTDVDGGVMNITAITQPDNGVVTNNTHSISYEPNPDYCISGKDTDDFIYSLNTGSSATVSVTVNCIDDSPIAVFDKKEVYEDQASSKLLVLNNDTDIDSGPMTITGFTQPNYGSVTLSNNDLSYAPSLNYCNLGNTTDNFTYTLNGNSTAHVSVTVNCVNDAPSFSIIGDINLDTSELNNLNQLIVPNFTNNTLMGPSNESSQQILQYHINEISDTSDVINSLSIDNNGTLTILFSTHPGIAIASISMQDNGGISHNGEDTSGEINFNISFPEIIFENSFEEPTVFRLPEYLYNLSLNLNLYEVPEYDHGSHSIIYNKFVLESNSDGNINKFKIKQWIQEIESSLNSTEL